MFKGKCQGEYSEQIWEVVRVSSGVQLAASQASCTPHLRVTDKKTEFMQQGFALGKSRFFNVRNINL